jgi:hypothetical protein
LPRWDCLPLNMPAFAGRTMVQKLDLAEDTRYYHAVFEGPYLRYAINSFVM